MTLKEFFRKARRSRKWFVDAENKVRCARGFCPLAALTGGEWVPEKAASKLRMNPSTAWKIAGGADYGVSVNRKWLLKNLGIS